VICRGKQIAVHPRSYEREDFITNPLHYLALLDEGWGSGHDDTG